jgi:hypothetical protein
LKEEEAGKMAGEDPVHYLLIKVVLLSCGHAAFIMSYVC